MPAGGLLEAVGNGGPRWMTVHDRTRLIGRLVPFTAVGKSTDYGAQANTSNRGEPPPDRGEQPPGPTSVRRHAAVSHRIGPGQASVAQHHGDHAERDHRTAQV